MGYCSHVFIPIVLGPSEREKTTIDINHLNSVLTQWGFLFTHVVFATVRIYFKKEF